ncbi:hypothetical protein [Halomarina oriensis]|uniref:Uncharacterized protein n=1 Tax=Halomarina oriensis TaxID=671145 RepID=A0A6B0GJ56_9EURY|nr:hypothetical protein [Halomarina oriensis]MWG33861.1 hypothetical protein [Halomarina oriensis]
MNGHEQAVGREHAARALDRTAFGDGPADRASIAFDLTASYPDEAGLDALRRTVALDRAAGTVTITDEAAFREDGGDLESVVVSYHPITDDGGDLLVTGERGALCIETDGEVTAVEHLADAVDMSYRDAFPDERPDVWRARVGAAETDGSDRRVELLVRPVE